MALKDSKADEKAEDWRSEHAQAEDEPLRVARARAREPGRGRDATAPGQIPARGWRDILWRVLRNVSEDRVLSTAGSVAFFALLSVFPAIATIVSVYGFFADAASIRSHLALLDGLVPDGVLLLITDELARVATQRSDTLGLAFVVGLGIAFWSANGGVAALFDALNVVYKEREKRSLWRFYGTTFLFTLGGVVFVLLALGVVVVLPLALGLFGAATQAERLVAVARWPVLLLAVMLALALGHLGQRDRGAGLGRRLDAVLVVRRELRQLQPRLWLARRGHRLRHLDLDLGGRRAARRRTQRGDGAPDRARHDGRPPEAARHARRGGGGHGGRGAAVGAARLCTAS